MPMIAPRRTRGGIHPLLNHGPLAIRSCTPSLRIIRSAPKLAKKPPIHPSCPLSPRSLGRSHVSGTPSAPYGELITPHLPVMMSPKSTGEETSDGKAKAAQNAKVSLAKPGRPATADLRRCRAGQEWGDGSRL